MIRIAAVGDVHVGMDHHAFGDVDLEQLSTQVDVLLLAGDLTQHGHVNEAAILARELGHVSVPVVAVLGNHDYHQGQQLEVRRQLEQNGVRVLEGEAVEIDVHGCRLGIAGVKGFAGGFLDACGSEFGEDEMKQFICHTRLIAEKLGRALASLDCDVKVALTHYSPVRDTLVGEKTELYPFLGSHLLGEVIDEQRCAAAFHGHAHSGTEKGRTLGGVPVRNVARPVIKLAYKQYTVADSGQIRLHPTG